MKIRTDFVTNSSSSSFISITVEMKDGRSYYTNWESGNISLEYLDDLRIPEEVYRNMSSGEELLDLCYNYAKKVVASWQQEVPQYKMDNFGNSADKIREIKDFNNVVAKVSIENNLDVYEPIYEATESYDYETGQYTHVYHDIMNDEWYEGDEDFSEEEW